MNLNYLELITISILYLTYFILWKIKEVTQIKKTGIDPNVIVKSESNLQKYVGLQFKILSFFFLIAMIFNSIHFELFGLFTRWNLIDNNIFKVIGFIVGMFGLSICLYAQIKMGNSWRVGIDEKNKTKLITTGLYSIIRNPTYLGLFLLNVGFWIIIPTVTIFTLNIIFIYTLEIQVRCEEDYLEKTQGEEYLKYKKKTKRYIPFIY
ncbi:MAG: phospholipid methyltransferase [Spirochaetes bacterium GWD1_27_9]|nr:MAG: phospholipid methyltransferase [Spirochaetes bacterium GWB1_27_13]OHD22661.1 MAG: phospholipid methyltransferase [Spirochaetes bacterium GWC1_27_15]OHD33637.1 MAG: phospholipid methyltransferase [Spirochaetes bacterium GWD1_27_9]